MKLETTIILIAWLASVESSHLGNDASAALTRYRARRDALLQANRSTDTKVPDVAVDMNVGTKHHEHPALIHPRHDALNRVPLRQPESRPFKFVVPTAPVPSAMNRMHVPAPSAVVSEHRPLGTYDSNLGSPMSIPEGPAAQSIPPVSLVRPNPRFPNDPSPAPLPSAESTVTSIQRRPFPAIPTVKPSYADSNASNTIRKEKPIPPPRPRVFPSSAASATSETHNHSVPPTVSVTSQNIIMSSQPESMNHRRVRYPKLTRQSVYLTSATVDPTFLPVMDLQEADLPPSHFVPAISSNAEARLSRRVQDGSDASQSLIEVLAEMTDSDPSSQDTKKPWQYFFKGGNVRKDASESPSTDSTKDGSTLSSLMFLRHSPSTAPQSHTYGVKKGTETNEGKLTVFGEPLKKYRVIHEGAQSQVSVGMLSPSQLHQMGFKVKKGIFGDKKSRKVVLKMAQRGTDQESDLRKEATILDKLKHPNIIPLEKLIHTERNTVLVLPYYSQGTLMQYLESAIKSRLVLTRHRVRHVFYPLVQAIAYCHENGIAHRDIKPGNILLTGSYRHLTPILIDFGLAYDDKLNPGSIHDRPGTLSYAPPEYFPDGQFYDKYDDEDVDPFKADVWSLGVSLLVSLTGYIPENHFYVTKFISDTKQMARFSPLLQALLRGMLDTDMKLRWNIEQVQAHPWWKKGD